jgi:short-subunit dehydrogenase
MLAEGSPAHIVNVSSHVGLVSEPYLSPYQMTKHGIVTLSESLEKELKAKKAKIGVSVFFPYFVQSNLAHSDRHLREPLYVSREGKALLQGLSAMTDQGITPEKSAEILFKGVEAGAFYIFTDPETQKAFKARSEKILVP